MSDPRKMVVKLVLECWRGEADHLDRLVARLPDDCLLQAVAPGKATGLYLLGSLTAVQDRLFPMLGLSELIFPEYQGIFPGCWPADLPTPAWPPAEEVKQRWLNVSIQLRKDFARMRPSEWLQCNRVFVVLDAATRISFCLGQLSLLIKE